MAKSMTGYASKPFGAGRRSLHAAAVRPLHERQPVRRRNRRPRSDRVGREGLSDRSQPHRHGRLLDGRRVGVVLHRALRRSLGGRRAGRGLHRDRGVPARRARAAAAERRAADALAHVRLDRLRGQHVQRPGRGVLRRDRRAEAGRRRDGGGDARGRADARAHHRPEYRPRLRARRAAAGAGSPRCSSRPEGRNPVPDGDSLHDLDAALQHDVLAHGRRDGQEHWERARVDAKIDGDTHHADDRERDGAAPHVRRRPRAVRRRRRGRR